MSPLGQAGRHLPNWLYTNNLHRFSGPKWRCPTNELGSTEGCVATIPGRFCTRDRDCREVTRPEGGRWRSQGLAKNTAGRVFCSSRPRTGLTGVCANRRRESRGRLCPAGRVRKARGWARWKYRTQFLNLYAAAR